MVKKKLTDIVIDALEDIKAKDIRLVNVMKITSVFDYIAVACGDSNRQTKALANNVMEKVKEAGYQIYGIEGEQTGEWVLVDCGDVVVHIMQPAIREYYQLEELWSDGEQEFPPLAPKRVKAPAKEKPVASKPKAKGKGAGKKPATTARKKTDATKKPAAKKPAAKKPVAKRPAVKKATVKKPAVHKTVAKKPAMQKTTAKKPAVHKTTAKKPATAKRKTVN
ncbi:MAG: ribosome silencing factor [Betaproteobacteria bacterium]|nr:ribosome silencing factor [Betaproteobacteria bacterium]